MFAFICLYLPFLAFVSRFIAAILDTIGTVLDFRVLAGEIIVQDDMV